MLLGGLNFPPMLLGGLNFPPRPPNFLVFKCFPTLPSGRATRRYTFGQCLPLRFSDSAGARSLYCESTPLRYVDVPVSAGRSDRWKDQDSVWSNAT